MLVIDMVPIRGGGFTHLAVCMGEGSFGTGGSRAEAQTHDLVSKI